MQTFSASFTGVKPCVSKQAAPARSSVVARAQESASAQETSRRAAFALLAATAASPALAYRGQPGNVFGKTETNSTGFIPYVGDGYSLLIPSQWELNDEYEDDQQDIRYADHFDAVTTLLVVKKPVSAKSIKDYASPDKFLKDIGYLFGKQTWVGETDDGGDFGNQTAAAYLLDDKVYEMDGITYYEYELLIRTVDGDEGGRHQLVKAGVNADGELFILKLQAGDKRWMKGQKRNLKGALNSFMIA